MLIDVANHRRLTTGIFVISLSLVLVACAQLVPEYRRVSPTPTAAPISVGWNRITLGGGGGQAGLAVDPTNSQVVYATTDNGGLVKTLTGGEAWFSINHNIGNRYLGDSELDPLDPQVLYVVAEVYARTPSHNSDPVTGELYRTRNGGQTWEVVYAEGLGDGDGRCFGVVVWPSTRSLLIPYDRLNPARYDVDQDQLSDVIYVGGWDNNEPSADKRAGVWKSVDEGRTFTQLGLADKNIWVLRQHPDQPEWLYAGTYIDGLFFSPNGGVSWVSWRERLPLPTISDIAVDGARNTLYVATNVFYTPYRDAAHDPQRGLYKSVDGGQTFYPINRGLELTSRNFPRVLLDVVDPSGQTLYTGPWDPPNKTMYKSSDGGETWRPMAVEVWSQPAWLDEFENLWDLAQGSDGALYAATWSGLYRLNRATETWEIKVTGLGNIGVRRVAFEPGNTSVIYLGMLDSTPWKSTDRGQTWRSLERGFLSADGKRRANASDFAISPTNPQVVYATAIGPSTDYLSGVLRSANGGESWQQIVTGLPPTSSADPQWQANAIAVSPRDPNRAWVALELKSGGGGIYHTTDSGQHWQSDLMLPERPTDIAVSVTEMPTVVVSTRSGVVYLSDDGGLTWRSTQVSDTLLYAVDVFPTDPSRILIGANIVGALLSEDGGRTWRTIFDDLALQPFIRDLALSPFARQRYYPSFRAVRFHPTNPNRLYLGHHAAAWMGVGVLTSADGGQTWTQLADTAFQMRSVSSIDVDLQTGDLVVGTWEVYYYDANSP
jgi:photosystem II stability/assembly factor-like uncharacterized protein